MPPKVKVRKQGLSAAIELFADLGCYGVSTRDLAKKSRTSPGSIYRVFGTREKLFEAAVNEVIEQALDPAQLLLMLFEEEPAGKRDASTILIAVLQRWYASLSQRSARLLTQAYFVKPLVPLSTAPYAPIDKIIEILATAITRARQAHPAKIDGKSSATAIILALLHCRIISSESGNKNPAPDPAESLIRVWLRGVFPA
jgi:AcrR family transcriptional regulator